MSHWRKKKKKNGRTFSIRVLNYVPLVPFRQPPGLTDTSGTRSRDLPAPPQSQRVCVCFDDLGKDFASVRSNENWKFCLQVCRREKLSGPLETHTHFGFTLVDGDQFFFFFSFFTFEVRKMRKKIGRKFMRASWGFFSNSLIVGTNFPRKSKTVVDSFSSRMKSFYRTFFLPPDLCVAEVHGRSKNINTWNAFYTFLMKNLSFLTEFVCLNTIFLYFIKIY